VVLQVIAAILAVRLIPLTGRRLAWSLIAGAILLIVIRRCIAIYSAIETPPDPLDVLEASVNLVISFLLAIGMWLIAPMFRQFAQAQQALKESEAAARRHAQELEQIYRYAPIGLAVLDCDLRYLRANEMLAQSQGRTVEELRGKTVPDLFPEIMPRLRELYAPVLNEGRPVLGVEVSGVRSKDGSVGDRLVSYFPLKSDTGDVIGIVAAVLDITGRKRVEQELEKYRKGLEELVAQRTRELDRTIDELRREAQVRERTESELRESERRYRLLFEQSPVPLWEYDFSAIKAELDTLAAAGVRDWKAHFREHPHEALRIAAAARILNVNQAALETFGARTQDELIANFSKLLGPKVPGQFALDLECLALEGTERSSETDGWDLQGRHHDLETRWVMVEPRDPGFLRVLASQVDITEQKQAEQALRTVAHKLIAVREEERRRVATDLHDSLAQGLVALKLAMHASNHTSAMEQCDRLIREVREICHGLYPAALEKLGLAAGLTQLAEAYEPSVSVTVDYAPEFADARFDKDLEISLYRVAQEAINNAVRHGKAGQIEVDLARGEGHIGLSVCDDGGGFDVAGPNHSGLGLMTMKDRIASIGGTLDITSQPGKTVVRATVPLPRNDWKSGD
jgi:PAS domain S-box-containing protein